MYAEKWEMLLTGTVRKCYLIHVKWNIIEMKMATFLFIVPPYPSQSSQFSSLAEQQQARYSNTAKTPSNEADKCK